MALNDDLADDAALHALAVESATIETQAKVAKVLSDMQDDLEKSILAAGPDVSKSKKAIAALNTKTNGIITEALAKAQGLTDAELAGFAQESSLMLLESIQDELTDWPLNVLNKQELLAVAKGNAILGTPAADYWAGQDVATRTKFKRLMDQGVLQGLTNAELVRSVAGTKAAGFNDGIMKITRSQADGLVRTSVMNVSNKARQATYMANKDLIKGIQHISTLDDRTSEICQARSGSVYEIDQLTGDLKPAQTGFTFDGGPPYHIRCRSTTAPIVRSWDELNRSKDPEVVAKLKKFNPTPSTRASMDGQVPEGTTFAAFAKKKGDAFIKDVLPPGKAQLVIDGKISMRDLIDKHGKVRSLGQLQALKGGAKSKAKGLRIPDIRSKQIRFGPAPPTPAQAAEAAKAVATAKEAAMIATEHAKMVTLSKALNKKGVKNAAFGLPDSIGLKGIKSNIKLLEEMDAHDTFVKAQAAKEAAKEAAKAKAAAEAAKKKAIEDAAKAKAAAIAAEKKAKAFAEKQALALKKAKEEAAEAAKKAAEVAKKAPVLDKLNALKAEMEALGGTPFPFKDNLALSTLKGKVPKFKKAIAKLKALENELELKTKGLLSADILQMNQKAKALGVDTKILGIGDNPFTATDFLMAKTKDQLGGITNALQQLIANAQDDAAAAIKAAQVAKEAAKKAAILEKANATLAAEKAAAEAATKAAKTEVIKANANIPLEKMTIAQLKVELETLAQAAGKTVDPGFFGFKRKKKFLDEIAKLKAPIPTTGRILPTKASLKTEGNFPHPDDVTVVKKLGGSTGAQLVKGPDGKLYVMKKGGGGNAADHIRQELVADNAYRAAGVNVPEATIFETSAGPVKLARFLEGDSLDDWARKASPAQIKAMKKALSEDFHMDALMGNWDVVGMSGDNILIDKAGKPWRIDNGGSMQFRAQGSIKEGRQWNGHPSELWSMRGKALSSSDAVKDIYGLNNAQTAKWFGDADIFEISERIQRTDWAAVKAVTNDPVLIKRINEMERLAKKGSAYKKTSFMADRADPIMMHMNALNQEGVTDAMPNLMKRTGGARSTQFVDEHGNPWDGLRGSQGGIKPVVHADDPYMNDLLGAVKTVAFHNSKGDLSYNTTAITAAKKAVAGIKASGNAALKKHHAATIKWVEEHANKGLLAKKVPDPPQLSPWVDTNKAAKAATPKKGSPATALWDHIENTLGLPTSHIGDWQSAQAGSSWSPGAAKFKNWIKKGIADFDPDKAYFKVSSSATYTAAEEQAMHVHQAFIQELLGKTEFEGNWKDAGAVRLFRTEKAGDLTNLYGMKPGDVQSFARGLNESHSPHNPISVAGKEVTQGAFPHTNVTGVYWMERPRSGVGSFLGDGENEFTTIPYKVPVRRIGDLYKINVEALIEEGKMTLDEFTARNNIPLSEILDL